jgi:UDP-N-acetylmuramate--alanine ligase
LTAAGLAPTGLAGGRVSAWGGNARLGGEALYVVEADEYDRAFLTLHPTVAVVNNVEADHLECYGSMEALEEAFVTFAGRARIALIGADDGGARRVGARLGAKARLFGLAADAAVRVSEVEQHPQGTRARVTLPESGTVELELRVPGLHNLRNAAGALGAVHALGGNLEAAVRALGAFRGVGRRFERIGAVRGIDVVDDYAHHPSELVATLAAARQAFPDRRLVAVFQPHLYSRTQQHAAAMGVALAAADLVIVTEIYAAREQPIVGVSGRQVADAARRAGTPTIFEADREGLGRRVLEELRDGDVVLTLGAGDITHVGPELVKLLAA